MKIELSRYSGFCMGVRDAVLKIVRELNKTHEKILVYGSLIHNPQTVEILGQRGLSTIRTLDDIDGKLVAIRTHGVPVELLREIRSRSRRYINLTCPRVSRVQGLIKSYSAKGYFTIIIGDADHAEVMGLKSYATSGVMVIQGADAISSIPPAPRYIVVSQTTQDVGKFDDFADALRKRFPDIKIFNTICDSTCSRQNDILAGIENGIDALVVVGGKESANTLRLAGMGREHKLKTFHIETEAELGEGDFSRVDHVLVTAGASTPGWIINNVMERLHEIKRKNSGIAVRWAFKSIDVMLRTNILSAAAAFFLTLFVQTYNGRHPDQIPAVISLLYIFAMYTINNLLEIKAYLQRNPVKYAVLSKYRYVLFPLALASLSLSCIMILRYDTAVIALYLLSCLLGALYSTGWIKALVTGTRSIPLNKLYNLKNVVSSFGWLIVTSIIPLLIMETPPRGFIAPCVFVFTVIILRNIYIDVIAFQGDLIFGRQSLPTLLGIEKTTYLAILFSLLSSVVYAVLTAESGNYGLLLFTANLLYAGVIYIRIFSKKYYTSLWHEILLDLNLAAFIALYLAY